MAAILTSGRNLTLRKMMFKPSRLSLLCYTISTFQTSESLWTSSQMGIHTVKHMMQKQSYSITTSRPTSVKIPPNVVQESLSNTNKERIVKMLKEMKKRKITGLQEAAVLVPLCTVDGKPSLLFTLRSTALKTHRGQVSFPGGKRDKDDKTLVDTAIRETVEETGIKESTIDVWGTLPPMPDRKRNNAATGVVSFLGEVDVKSIEFNQNEVSEVFHLTLEHILANRRYTKYTSGFTMPVFINGPHLVWGMTSTMMDFFFEMLFPGYYTKIFAYSGKEKLPLVSKAIKDTNSNT